MQIWSKNDHILRGMAEDEKHGRKLGGKRIISLRKKKPPCAMSQAMVEGGDWGIYKHTEEMWR